MKGVNPIRSCVSFLDMEFVKFPFVGIPRQFGFSNTSSVDNGREDFVGFVRMIIFEKRNAFQLMWSDVRIKIRIYFFKELFPVIVFSLKQLYVVLSISVANWSIKQNLIALLPNTLRTLNERYKLCFSILDILSSFRNQTVPMAILTVVFIGQFSKRNGRRIIRFNSVNDT